MSFVANSLACVRGERPIFVDLDFDLQDGSVLQISGRNGAGKSSLMRVLTGLMPPARGTLLWQGNPISDDLPAFQNDLHYIGHKNPIKDRLTVFENLKFWARFGQEITNLDADTKVTSALEAFMLISLKDVPARLLSSGQRRRLNLARLLLQDRKMWILDEPTVGLDQVSLTKIEVMIENHRRKGGIVLVTTHSRLTLLQTSKLDMDDFSPADRDLSLFWNEETA